MKPEKVVRQFSCSKHQEKEKTMKLKTGIIGCGKVGDFHAKAYAQLENSEFTAVCDANLERAKAFAERYNVHAYSDIAEMIQKEHLDVVSVCTPHPIH